MARGGICSPDREDWQKVLLQGIGLFLIIFGCRCWLIHTYGSDLPYWDQWDGEAMNIYIPYFEGKLHFLDLFKLHNEHRIFLGRLAALSLILINGQWDALVQMTVNAAVYAGIVVMLFRFIITDDDPAPLLSGAILVVFSLPFGWENTLAGFQLSFYLMTGLSILAIRFLIHSDFGSWQWFLGCCCSLLLLFALASGFLACMAVLALLLLSVAVNKRSGNVANKLPTIFFCMMVIVAGLLLKGNVPLHNELHAHSVYAFLAALAANLSWPVPLPLLFGLCQWVPFLIFLIYGYIKKQFDPKYDLVMGIGIMVVLQAAATAYSRGGGGIIWPSSRYQDILALGIPVNFYLLLTMRNGWGKSFNKKIIQCGFIIWIFSNCIGLVSCTYRNFKQDMPAKRAAQTASIVNLREIIKTGNYDQLKGTPNVDLPYPDPKRLAMILKNPEIGKRLPPSLNPDAQPGILRIVLQPVLNMAPFMIFCGGVCLFLGLKDFSPSTTPRD